MSASDRGGQVRFERLPGLPGSRIILSCEHASNALPEPWSWPAADSRLVEDHWAWDPGAEALTRALSARLGAPALLARATRLLVDLNRPLDSPTLFRDRADGLPVGLNVTVDERERLRRVSEWYEPYHRAFATMVAEHPEASLLVSVHTFTPVYEGTARDVEIGVLWDLDEAFAQRVLSALGASGHNVQGNEPYSGASGMMYSVQHQATEYGRIAVEFEVRQDLLRSAAGVQQVSELLAGVLADSLAG